MAKFVTVNNGKKHLYDLSNLSQLNNDLGFGTGNGDMLKKNYDSNNDGKVDYANNADSVDWSGISNKPNSLPSLIDTAVSERHTHDNKTTIDKFSDDNGQLFYNGMELAQTGSNATKLSAFYNDIGYITGSAITGKADKLTNIVADNILTMSSDGGLRDSGKKISDFATATQGTKADNALPSSSYTASDILSKLETVDGAGSLLDADKLDGQEGSYYAPINSPTFTGTPKSVTPSTSDNSTNIATTAFVKSQNYLTSVSPNSVVEKVIIDKNSTAVGTRKEINFIEGTGISLTVNDDSTNDRVNITLNSTASGVGTVTSVNSVNPNVSGNVTLTKSDLSLGNVDNVEQLPLSYLDTTSTLANNSDTKVPSQKAIKTYVDNGLATKSTVNSSTTNGNLKINGTETTIYTLPVPTSNTIGGVKAGSNITIDSNGVISAPSTGGTVTNISSVNTDIGITNPTTTPILTLNSGIGANQIVKLDANAKYPSNDGSQITGLTKSQVGLGNVVNLDTSTTSNITDSTNKRFITDAQKTVLGNTSGTNTGDETSSTIKTKLGSATTTLDGYLTSVDWNTFNNKQNKIYLQSTQPSSPILDDIWINNTSTPYIMNVYNGTIFVQVGGTGSGGATISTWTSGTAYAIKDIVIENNNIYQCIIANSDGSWNATNWNLISSGVIQIQSDWNQTDNSKLDYIKNKPTLATVATSGSYSDLSNKPTLPSGTIVGNTDSQILTNKTLNDTTTTIQNTTDNTKKVKLDVSAVTTGNTRTLSIPDKNGTIALTSDVISLAGDLTGANSSPQLVSSGVTAGNYTLANITVDSKGRITSASNGSVVGATINDSGTIGDITETYSVNKILSITNNLNTNIGDVSTLTTTNKSSTVSAINELKSTIASSNTATNISYNNSSTGVSATNTQAMLDYLFISSNNFKNGLAGVIGSPSSTTETFSQLTSDLANLKASLATYLTNKGVPTTSSETIYSMVSKVNQITVTSNPVQRHLNITASTGSPYTYTFTYTKPISISNLCQTVILYTSGSNTTMYTCNFNSTDSSSFIVGSNMVLDGLLHLPIKTTTGTFTNNGTVGSGTEWLSIALDNTVFNTIDQLIYTDGTTPSLTINGTYYPAFTYMNSDIGLSGIYQLNSIAWTANTSGTGVVLAVISVDSGNSWYAYNTTSSTWVNVDITKLSDIKSKGMNSTVVNALTTSQLEQLRNNSVTMRFGYYIEMDNYSDIANVDTIQVNAQSIGTYSIAPYANYTVSLNANGSTLTYVFTVSGNYYLNIEDNLA